MRIFFHAFYTWLIAVILSLISLVNYELLKNSWYSINNILDSQMLVFVFMCYVVTLPALILSSIFLSFIFRTMYSAYEKFSLWYLGVAVAICLNILVPVLLFDMINVIPEIFTELWPVLPASFLAVTIRYRQFILLNTNQTSQGESQV